MTAPWTPAAPRVSLHAYGDAAILAHYVEGCRKAGLPE